MARTIETDTEKFIASLDGWPSAPYRVASPPRPDFSAAVFGAIAHCAILGGGAYVIDRIAREFQVDHDTVRAWATGGASADIDTGRRVVAFIRTELETRLRDVRSRRGVEWDAIGDLSLG